MKVIEFFLNNLILNLVGGSADLSGSNNTKTSNSNIFSKNYGGNYIHFGVLNMVWQLFCFGIA